MHAINTPAGKRITSTSTSQTASVSGRSANHTVDDQSRRILEAYERFFLTIWNSSEVKTNPTKSISQPVSPFKSSRKRKPVASPGTGGNPSPSFAASPY